MSRVAKPARAKARTRAMLAAPDEALPPQPVANAARGEHELALAGVTYRLRPSRAAIGAIEAKTGRSMLELAQSGGSGSLTLAQLGIIATALIHAGAADEMTRMITAERFEELIFENGIAKPMAAFTLCLLDAATGGRTAAGNVRAAAV